MNMNERFLQEAAAMGSYMVNMDHIADQIDQVQDQEIQEEELTEDTS